MKIYFPFALVAILCLTYCSPAPQEATNDTTATENQETAAAQDQPDNEVKQVSQKMPDPNISPSQILKDNEAAYNQLHKTLKRNIKEITIALDKSDMHEKIKAALKSSYAEVIKYDNIYDIAKTSTQVSAETIAPYISGLQAKLVELNVKLK